MKTLYQIYCVTKNEEIIALRKDGLVVAEDEDEAKFLAGVDVALRENKLKPSDVTVLCHEIGDVKVHEKIKKVKVVKDED